MSDISADVLLGSGFFEFHLNALSLGSIVNLSHYVNRLDISEKSLIEIDFNRLDISKKKSIEIDFNRKLVRMHFFVYKMTDKYEFFFVQKKKNINFIFSTGISTDIKLKLALNPSNL